MGSNGARTILTSQIEQAHNNRDRSCLRLFHLPCDKYRVHKLHQYKETSSLYYYNILCDPLPQKGLKVAGADTSYHGKEARDDHYVRHLTALLQPTITFFISYDRSLIQISKHAAVCVLSYCVNISTMIKST